MGSFRRKFKRQVTRGGKSLRHRMVAAHEDVLQNIEFAIVTRARADSAIDDVVIKEALESLLLGGKTSPNPLVADLMDALRGMRAFRANVPDDVWADGLRVVLASVRLHSSLRPGSRGYVDFVSPYVR